jgi:ketosteroid isomerase-like protein
VANGQQLDLPNIYVVRVRGGEIVEPRDYTAHVAFARAFNRLGPLAAALATKSQ